MMVFVTVKFEKWNSGNRLKDSGRYTCETVSSMHKQSGNIIM